MVKFDQIVLCLQLSEIYFVLSVYEAKYGNKAYYRSLGLRVVVVRFENFLNSYFQSMLIIKYNTFFMIIVISFFLNLFSKTCN